MKQEIELGDVVEDICTGFKGVATARTEFLNGCIQFLVAPRWDGKLKEPPSEVGIDSQSLKIIKRGHIYKEKHKVKKKSKENGGPNRLMPKMRGF